MTDQTLKPGYLAYGPLVFKMEREDAECSECKESFTPACPSQVTCGKPECAKARAQRMGRRLQARARVNAPRRERAA